MIAAHYRIRKNNFPVIMLSWKDRSVKNLIGPQTEKKKFEHLNQNDLLPHHIFRKISSVKQDDFVLRLFLNYSETYPFTSFH